MADIFREVDEEVRKDRFHALWDRYGIYVYIVIAALILGTAGKEYWQYYQREQRLADAASYESALADLKADKTSAAVNELTQLADNAGTGYAVLARLREAAARAEAGDVDAAVQAYDRLAADEGVDPIYRDLARLLAAQRLVDTGAGEQVRQRLAPLLAGSGPWRFAARELEAVVALTENQPDKAREILQSLADGADTPNGVRQRAGELLAALAGEE